MTLDLDELERIGNAATPPPWRFTSGNCFIDGESETVCMDPNNRNFENDGSLMIAARNNWQAIVDALREAELLREENERLKKSEAYYRTAAMQVRTDNRPPFVPSRVHLPRRVSGDFPIGHALMAGPGDFECHSNKYGAVSVKAENGQMLGLRLNEFEVLEWRENH